MAATAGKVSTFIAPHSVPCEECEEYKERTQDAHHTHTAHPFSLFNISKGPKGIIKRTLGGYAVYKIWQS